MDDKIKAALDEMKPQLEKLLQEQTNTAMKEAPPRKNYGVLIGLNMRWGLYLHIFTGKGMLSWDIRHFWRLGRNY